MPAFILDRLLVNDEFLINVFAGQGWKTLTAERAKTGRKGRKELTLSFAALLCVLCG